MDLTDNDVTNVANFMGHDDQIHHDVYRHNAIEREIVQMSTLLEGAQGKVIDESSSEGVEVEVKKKAKRSTSKIATAKSNRKEKTEKRGGRRRT